MTVKEMSSKITNNITPEMIDRAIEIGIKGSLLIKVASASAMADGFHSTVRACVAGAAAAPLGSSPNREHHLAKTGLIGGIQLGIVLALLAQGIPAED